MEMVKEPQRTGRTDVAAEQSSEVKANIPEAAAKTPNAFMRFWTSITVEPVIVSFVVGLYLMALTDQNMYLEKACLVNQNYSADVCAQLMLRESEGIETEDKLTEAAYNGIQIWTRPLSSWLSSCLVLFWGAWSDRSGLRKPCIIFPLAAQLIISLTNLVSSCVLVRTPLEVPMFSNAIVDGLSGGAGTLLVGVYSYLSDVTAPADLSYRVGVTNVCLLVGNIFGNAVSGLVVRYLGFLAVYGLSASLFVFGLVYTVFCIREQPATASAPARTPVDGSKEEQQQLQQPKCLLRRFFDIDHVVQTFRVVLRTDPAQPHRRPVIVLLLIVWVLIAGPMQSEGSLLYLFTRLQFSWTEVEQSFLGTFSSITSLIGSTFIVDVLSGRLAATDATIAVVGLTSKLLANCVYAAAQVSWVFFGGCCVEMLSAGTNIAMRSIASKAVAGDEVGKMNALLALVESAVPLVFLPLYVTVYDGTRDYWPSAFLALGVVLMLPAMPVFIWMGRYFKRSAATDAEGREARAGVELAAGVASEAHDNRAFVCTEIGNERIKSNAETTYL